MNLAHMSWSDRRVRAFAFNSALMFILPLFHALSFAVSYQQFIWTRGYWFLPLFEGLFVMIVYAVLKSFKQLRGERKSVVDILWIIAWTLLAAAYNAVGTIVIFLFLVVLSI